MPNLQLFAFNDQSVRVISIEGDPWFVAQDVLTAIKSATTVTAAKTVIGSDLGEEFVNNHPLKTSGGIQEFTVFSEAAVTFLVSRSRTETGKAFNRLLHSEILPAIRKTGRYEVNPQQAITPALPQDYIEALEAHLNSEKEKKVLAEANQKLLQEKQVLQLTIAKTAPKVELFNVYVSSDGWLTGEQIAKQFSVSTRKMFDTLRATKAIFQRSGRNVPSAKWVKEGWATMRPVKCHDSVVRSSLVFSHKALEQIFDLLKFDGLIPVNSDYQTHLDFDSPKPMKRADPQTA